LDIIGQVAFSHEFKALESVEHWAKGEGDGDISLAEIDDPFIQALVQTFKPSLLGTIFLILGIPVLSKYFDPTKRNTRLALDAAVDRVIANARASIETENNNGSSSMKQQRSLLQLLLQASNGESPKKQKTLNDLELRDETKTFIFAGHETTSTWCYMAIYALVTNPRIQDKVYQDIVRHAPPKNKTLDSETVDKMEYLNAFLQEVLRLHSPVGMFTRINTTTEHFGGYTVPAGTRLIIAPYLLHRHPKYWSDPETFEPERWLQKEANEEFLSQIRFAFLPFSAGGRNCIGQRFATIEAKLIMAELIRSFVFRLAPSQKDTEFTFSNIVVMKTKPRLKIVVKSRD
jgi:cytochrome P450